jgi:lysophospholipase L1-like esterase
MDSMIPSTKYLLIIALVFLQLTNAFVSNAQKVFFTSTIVNRVAVNEKYTYNVAVIDSSKKTIQFSCLNLPSWLSFDTKNNILSGIAKKTGQYAIQITASNGDTTLHQNFMLTVFNKQTMNILPLGNSLTNGSNMFNSYRRDLWQMLHKANYNFDFIGSWDKPNIGGNVPNADFDMDHDGHSGWKASDLLNQPDWDKQKGNIKDWLQTYTPDIVLLEFGTNEVFQCVTNRDAINNIDTVIQLLREKNKSVKILLAQIPPLGAGWANKKLCNNDIEYAKAVIEFNKAILQYGKAKNSTASPIIIVDQFTGVNPAVDMYDDIHPNAIGEKKMAGKWFAAIKKYLRKLN